MFLRGCLLILHWLVLAHGHGLGIARYLSAVVSHFLTWASALSPWPSSKGPSIASKGTRGTLGKGTRGQRVSSPKVMAIIISSRDHDDLRILAYVRILTWCFQQGLVYIFLYDPAGYMKRYAHLLEKQLTARLDQPVTIEVGYARRASGEPQNNGEGSGTEGGSCHGGLETLANGWAHMGPHDTPSTVGSELGSAKQYVQEGGGEGEGSEREVERKLCVHILSAADSHTPLVEAARCGPGREQLNGKDGKLGPDELDQQLRAVSGEAAVLEPALALVIGETLTLAGYPPWPLRFTQIYHMGRLSEINEKLLDETLTSYGSVLQRYGT